MTIKRLLDARRQRKIPAQFSWVDHRLVRDKYICRCGPEALALYLLLVTVSDAEGLSYYSDQTAAGLLSMQPDVLRQARRELLEAGLIAYRKPLYQVLSLSGESR
jgi:replication initiation and membrane attachment protein DnaB